jgi:hypothetical protein
LTYVTNPPSAGQGNGGLPGTCAPSTDLWPDLLNLDSNAPGANAMNGSAFSPGGSFTASKATVEITTADAVNTDVCLAIYDAAGTRLATTGITANAGTTGLKTINFVAPVFLTAGTLYYACVSVNSGSTVVRALYNSTTAVYGSLYGSTLGTVRAFARTSSHTAPATIDATGLSAIQRAVIICVLA